MAKNTCLVYAEILGKTTTTISNDRKLNLNLINNNKELCSTAHILRYDEYKTEKRDLLELLYPFRVESITNNSINTTRNTSVSAHYAEKAALKKNKTDRVQLNDSTVIHIRSSYPTKVTFTFKTLTESTKRLSQLNNEVHAGVTTQNKRDKISNLSRKEVDIIEYLSQGLTDKEIGEKLFLSHRTIGNIRQKLLEKCDVKNTTELVSKSIRVGIIE